MANKGLDLNNPDDKKAIQEVLRQGVDGQFWDIICQRIKTSLEALQSQLDADKGSLPAEEYKILTEVLRKQKVDRQDILAMPEDLVRELDNPDFFKQDNDDEIYAEPKDFES